MIILFQLAKSIEKCVENFRLKRRSIVLNQLEKLYTAHGLDKQSFELRQQQQQQQQQPNP
jgi:hypothetical protein